MAVATVPSITKVKRLPVMKTITPMLAAYSNSRSTTRKVMERKTMGTPTTEMTMGIPTTEMVPMGTILTEVATVTHTLLAEIMAAIMEMATVAVTMKHIPTTSKMELGVALMSTPHRLQ